MKPVIPSTLNIVSVIAIVLASALFSVSIQAEDTAIPDRQVLGVRTISVENTSGLRVTRTTAGATVALEVGTLAGNPTAGVAQTYFVKSVDASSNPTTDYNGTVHITLSDPSGIAPPDVTVVNGSANFNVTLLKSGIQVVTATDTVNPSLTGRVGILLVMPGPLAKLGVSAPDSVIAGTSLSATVAGQDAFGNTIPTYAGTVHFTSSDSSAVLPSDATLTNGTGTFLITLNTVGVQTVTATDTVNVSISGGSDAIFVSPANSTPGSSPPMAFPNPAFAGIPVQFTIPGQSPETAVSWDFGDGSPLSAGGTIEHIYAAAGTYTATETSMDPNTGTGTSQSLTIVVNDLANGEAAFLAGTAELKIKQGRLRFFPGYLQLNGVATFQGNPYFGDEYLVITVNGYSESFLMNHVGNFSSPRGTLIFRNVASPPKTVAFSIFLHNDDLSKGVAQNVSLDQQGRPTKVLITLSASGLVGSYITSLKYASSALPGKAKFGHK